MTNQDENRQAVTMQSVARAAGVSPMTVSNSFRYPGRVLEETRDRVFRVAAELGYVPNHSAGNLSSGRSRIIGAVIPSIKNSSFYKYVRGIQEYAAAQGYELVLKLAESRDDEAAAIQTFIGLRVAGIILVGNQHAAGIMDFVLKSATPVVEAWVSNDAVDMAVGYSTTGATQAMASLLIRRGCRRIGFVGYEGASSRRYTERIPAFRECLQTAGLDSHRICFVDEADGFGAGPKALDDLCRIDLEVDGIICPTDIIAAGVLFECSRKGWKVPERMAVTGWGDYEIASEITPGLTTLQPNAYEMGAKGAELIIKRALGEVVMPKIYNIGFDVILRESA